MKTRILAQVGTLAFEHECEGSPLGWRWWRRTYHQHEYADERCISLGAVEHDGGGTLLLVAMEQDGTLQLTTPHMLFPILDNAEAEAGAEAFGRAVLQRYAVAPKLL